jgi:membrane protease YdiL (CAAX protease family)
VLRSLRDQNRFALYCLLAGAAAFLAAASSSGLALLSLHWIAEQPDAIPRRDLPVTQPFFWLLAGLVAPLLETLIYRWLLTLLTRHLRLPLALGLASLLAGAAHGPYPVAFFATSASFFVYALAWHHWRHVSSRKSYWAPATAHAISNSLIVASAFLISMIYV